MTFLPITTPTQTRGSTGESYVVSEDQTVHELLRLILQQITVANIQLASMTGEEHLTPDFLNY